MTTQQPTADSEDAGALSAAETLLRKSLKDASVLLWYATREGKQVSKQTIGDIVLAQSSLSAGARGPEVERRFWVALEELAAAVKPASVEAILATYNYPLGHHGEGGKRRSVDAAATKKTYSFAAVVVLVLLLVVQMLWFIGTTIRADLETHRDEFNVEVALWNSKFMLAILSQYVLPLLYGLLGALAYILRTLSGEIQNVTFTRASKIRYSLRWPRGMLGGVTIGLFFDPAALSGFAAMTPLGLAILAGYGVELLLTGSTS